MPVKKTNLNTGKKGFDAPSEDSPVESGSALPEESLYDFDQLPATESTATAQIQTPGVIGNLKAEVKIATGKFKDADKVEHLWKGLQLTLTDPMGLEHIETYFAPPGSAEEVKYVQKKYEVVDGKTVETRECTPQETLKILNNEFISYLIDLGEAFGYKHDDILNTLVKNAKGFDSAAKIFIEKFKPAEARRIWAKILYNNNVKKQTSFLSIHGSYPKYYPYGNDLYDAYFEGKATVLKLNKWESTNGLTKKFTGTTDAPKQGSGAQQTVHKSGTATGVRPVSTEKDPF